MEQDGACTPIAQKREKATPPCGVDETDSSENHDFVCALLGEKMCALAGCRYGLSIFKSTLNVV